ncbi:MAG: gamma-glutamylcyclotransferase family protein, partial [Ilumatobacteraceae bacterium]
MTGTRTWVFGYGSLVSPGSFGATIGRRLRVGPEFVVARLDGFGRRWNYGIRGFEGVSAGWDGAERTWTLVALGVTVSPSETVNGVVAPVSTDELAALDRREREYDRVDVTASIGGVDVRDGDRVVTYVPRPAAVARAASAHSERRAAIELRYSDLVLGAFADLGPAHRERHRAAPPDEGVPVV